MLASVFVLAARYLFRLQSPDLHNHLILQGLDNSFIIFNRSQLTIHNQIILSWNQGLFYCTVAETLTGVVRALCMVAELPPTAHHPRERLFVPAFLLAVPPPFANRTSLLLAVTPRIRQSGQPIKYSASRLEKTHTERTKKRDAQRDTWRGDM